MKTTPEQIPEAESLELEIENIIEKEKTPADINDMFINYAFDEIKKEMNLIDYKEDFVQTVKFEGVCSSNELSVTKQLSTQCQGVNCDKYPLEVFSIEDITLTKANINEIGVETNQLIHMIENKVYETSINYIKPKVDIEIQLEKPLLELLNNVADLSLITEIQRNTKSIDATVAQSSINIECDPEIKETCFNICNQNLVFNKDKSNAEITTDNYHMEITTEDPLTLTRQLRLDFALLEDLTITKANMAEKSIETDNLIPTIQNEACEISLNYSKSKVDAEIELDSLLLKQQEKIGEVSLIKEISRASTSVDATLSYSSVNIECDYEFKKIEYNVLSQDLVFKKNKANTQINTENTALEISTKPALTITRKLILEFTSLKTITL